MPSKPYAVFRSHMSEMNVGFNPKIKTSRFKTLDVALYRDGSIKQNIKPIYTQKLTCISHKINDNDFTGHMSSSREAIFLREITCGSMRNERMSFYYRYR